MYPTQPATNRDKKLAVIYARFSSDLQNAKSIEDQVYSCKKLLRPNERLIRTYEDRSLSGAFFFNRPDAVAMQEAVMTGQIDVILCESMDRISRNMEDTAKFYRIVKFQNAEIRTVIDGEINECHVGIASLVSGMELTKIRERTYRGKRGMALAGRVAGSNAYGYDLDPIGPDGTLRTGFRKINEQQAEVVRGIFDRYINGASTSAIVRWLNGASIKSPRGGLWTVGSIKGKFGSGRGILQNRMYIGEVVWGRFKADRHPLTGGRVNRKVDPTRHVTFQEEKLRIVKQEVWNAAEKRILRTYRPAQIVNGRTVKTRIRIRCQHCDHPLIGVDHRYFLCAGRKRFHSCPEGKKIDAAMLYRLLYATVYGRLEAMTNAEWRRSSAMPDEEVERQRLEIDCQIAAAKEKLGYWHRAIEDGVRVGKQTHIRMSSLESQIDELELELDGLDVKNSGAPRQRQNILDDLRAAHSTGLRQRALDEILKDVKLGQNERGKLSVESMKFRKTSCGR